MAPLLIGLARGAGPAAWGAFAAAGLLILPAAGGCLYANVHVGLYPQVRLASFMVNVSLLAMLLFWFFVPLATPLVAGLVLAVWGRRAARAFDRLEPA